MSCERKSESIDNWLRELDKREISKSSMNKLIMNYLVTGRILNGKLEALALNELNSVVISYGGLFCRSVKICSITELRNVKY